MVLVQKKDALDLLSIANGRCNFAPRLPIGFRPVDMRSGLDPAHIPFTRCMAVMLTGSAELPFAAKAMDGEKAIIINAEDARQTFSKRMKTSATDGCEL